MKQPVERRLAAILAADVAGYSRLMGVDEEGTHERLRAHLRELVDPKIKEHRGRIVKNTGDGLLAEFASVVDAVRCAVEVQRGMVDRNADVPTEGRIEFRIGINLGDVIVEGGDIFGDGVNGRRQDLNGTGSTGATASRQGFDRSPAVRQYERRSRAGILRGWEIGPMGVGKVYTSCHGVRRCFPRFVS
jgi:class 3 adenylate cyclase